MNPCFSIHNILWQMVSQVDSLLCEEPTLFVCFDEVSTISVCLLTLVPSVKIIHSSTSPCHTCSCRTPPYASLLSCLKIQEICLMQFWSFLPFSELFPFQVSPILRWRTTTVHKNV